MTTLSFRVYGIPVAKGSMRAFMHNGKPILTTSAKGLGEWTQKIAAAASQKRMPIDMDSPIQVDITFYMHRPKTLPKKVFIPAKRPDIDKLARAVLDALTGILWNDDSQVYELTLCKQFANENWPEGATIIVRYLYSGGADV